MIKFAFQQTRPTCLVCGRNPVIAVGIEAYRVTRPYLSRSGWCCLRHYWRASRVLEARLAATVAAYQAEMSRIDREYRSR